LLRLGAALRIFAVAEHEVEAHSLDRQSWWFLGPILALVWLGSAAVYWNLEHGVNASVKTFGDALYWAFITATTVGYGDITPVTPEGRIVAGFVIFVGIGLVGFASAQLTQRVLRIDGGDMKRVLAKLDGLERDVRDLRRTMGAENVSKSVSGGETD
jgi:voltage-gated potassium channel